MRELLELIDRLRSSDIPLLIQGESGTGKELVARAVHSSSQRAAKPFISENCAAIPDTLLESVLFGHVAGAFTGADSDQPGLLRLADGGTLFLDEIADASPALQKALLRALQEGEVRPVGSRKTVAVDVRLICAANRSLKVLVSQGGFRSDLFYRVAGMTIELPTLRERKEDIERLAMSFLARSLVQPGLKLARDAIECLLAYDWPGNIRQLRNELEAAAALTEEGIIYRAHLSPELRGENSSHCLGPLEPLDVLLARTERDQLLRALSATESKNEAADRLAISRWSLYRKLAKYGIGS
jgi:two-component system response regulator HupR/HoxA